jgi:hypothetical protein
LALLSVIAIAVWAATRPEGGTTHIAEPALPLVFRFAPAEVHSFEVQRDGESLRFERREDGALRGAGDPVEAERALATFFRARVERRIAAATAEDERYGLTGPVLVVVLRRVLDQGEYRVRFGALAPDGLSRYVRFEGIPEVITLPDYHRANLEALFGDS